MARCTDPRCGYPNVRRDDDGEGYHDDDDHGPYPRDDWFADQLAAQMRTVRLEPAVVLVRLTAAAGGNRNGWTQGWNAVPYLPVAECEHGETCCFDCREQWEIDHEVAGPAVLPKETA